MVANSRVKDGRIAILGFMWRILPSIKSSLPIRRALTAICAPLETCLLMGSAGPTCWRSRRRRIARCGWTPCSAASKVGTSKHCSPRGPGRKPSASSYSRKRLSVYLSLSEYRSPRHPPHCVPELNGILQRGERYMLAICPPLCKTSYIA